MQSKSVQFYLPFAAFMALLVFTFSSCGGDDPVAPKPTADFTFSIDEATGLKVTFTNASENAVSYSWNFGVTGASSNLESPEYTYTASGAYTVVLTATGSDGSTSSKSKTVALTAVPQNLLINSDFVDGSNWTISDASNDPESGFTGSTILTFSNGLSFSGQYVDDEGNLLRNQASVFQAVELEAGTYEFHSSVTFQGAANTWISISVNDFMLDSKAGQTPPEDDDEGAFQILYADLNEECGKFSGDLSDIGCLGDSRIKDGKADGVFEISTAGTYYFSITAGQWEQTFGTTHKINSVGLFKIL